jgi:uncharacterized protein
MLEFTIYGAAILPQSQTPFIILFNEKEKISLSLPVGPFEASAIIIEMEGVVPPRPLTHDLFAQLFTKHHLDLLSVEIYACLEDSQLARINYRHGLVKHAMEVRPSDGIALAVRLDAPIYIAPEVTARCQTQTEYLHGAGRENGEILYLHPEATQLM